MRQGRDDRDDRDDDDGDAGRARRSRGHPLGEGALSSLGGRKVTGSTSLTHLLEEPVPRRRTPTPATPAAPDSAASARGMAKTPTSGESRSATAVAPPARHSDQGPAPEATETPTTPTTPTTRTNGGRRKRRGPHLLMVVGGLCLGALVAWVVRQPSPSTEAPDSVEAAAGRGEGGAPARAAAPPPNASQPGTIAPGAPVGPADEEPTPGDLPTAGSDEGPPIAELPPPSPEVLAENTWVRRNRAADIRTEARRLYVSERWEDAREMLLESLEWDPTNGDAVRNVSRTHQREHDMATALTWTRRALVTDPNDPRNHELLGDQLLMQGETDEAAAAYRRGLQVAPNDARLRSRLRRME